MSVFRKIRTILIFKCFYIFYTQQIQVLKKYYSTSQSEDIVFYLQIAFFGHVEKVLKKNVTIVSKEQLSLIHI